MKCRPIKSVLAALSLAAVSCGGSNGNADATQGEPSTGATDDPADGGPAPGDGSADDDGTSTTATSTGSTSVDPTGDPDADGDSTGDPTGPPIDAQRWELRVDFTPPVAVETWYSCFSFNIPVDQLYHIVGFEPAVTSPIIHHYVLSYTPTPLALDPLIPCVEWPAQILWAWAPGMGPLYLPEEAGFLVGHTGDTASFVLQVHYNNPLLQNFTDTDGIDVLYTDQLREHRAGVFSQGDIGAISIPPGQPAYPHTATCNEGETQSLLDHEINVFASFLHAHEIGVAIRSEVVRDGNVIGVMEEDPFDFNSQKFLPVDVSIAPGDRIETRCTYDSTGRTGTTNGGIASDEEMCINFLMYYPWVEAETCGSR